MEDLRDLIISKHLNEQSVLKLYVDALEHNDTKVMDACLNIIIKHFDEIVREPEINHIEFLNNVDFDNIIEILKSDQLNITHEQCLIEIVREYIKVRDEIKPDPKKITSAQQTIPPEVWDILTEDERKNREDAF